MSLVRSWREVPKGNERILDGLELFPIFERNREIDVAGRTLDVDTEYVRH